MVYQTNSTTSSSRATSALTPKIESLSIETRDPLGLRLRIQPDHTRLPSLPSLRSPSRIGEIASGNRFQVVRLVSLNNLENLKYLHLSNRGNHTPGRVSPILDNAALRRILTRFSWDTEGVHRRGLGEQIILEFSVEFSALGEFTVSTSSAERQVAHCPPTVRTFVIYGVPPRIQILRDTRQTAGSKIVVVRSNPVASRKHKLDLELKAFCKVEEIAYWYAMPSFGQSSRLITSNSVGILNDLQGVRDVGALMQNFLQWWNQLESPEFAQTQRLKRWVDRTQGPAA